MKLNISFENGIARITLESPPLNLLSNDVKCEIRDTFQSLAKNKDARVILFKTIGEHFCCGANLKEFPDRINNNEAKNAWIKGHEMLSAIIDTPQPTIVCVKGHALGGGAELASAFDIRIFADNASFGYPEVSRTVFPGNGGFERFIQIAGESHAPYLFLTGTKVSANDALRIGIANKIVGVDELEKEGEKIAKLISSYSNVTIQTIKKAIVRSRSKEPFFHEGMKYFDALHKTEDILESINAFLEKRKPVYKHK